MIRRFLAHIAIAAILLTVLCVGVLPRVVGQTRTPAPALPAQQEMAAAANAFLASLTAEQKAKAAFNFTDAERMNWHFTPGPWNGQGRKGLPWKDMTPEQNKLGHALLHTGLSQMGYEKAEATQMNEERLGGMEKAAGNTRIPRDPQNYYISIFGTPGGKDPWGWRFEGHHAAFNFTIANGDVAVVSAPNFLGSNPAKVPEGLPNAGLRILAGEEDLGRKLITSLSDDLRKVAIITATAPGEIITAEKARPDPIAPAGITGDKLTADQKKILMDLVSEYINRQRADLAKQDLDKITKAGGVDKLWFAWAGATEVGKPHYYRVQGPTFLIEYDNTQNNANHIHAVWRDAANDFGEDILKKHLAETPH